MGVLIHQPGSPVGELSVDGVFLFLIDFHIFVDRLVVHGHVLVLAKGVYKSGGLAENIIVLVIVTTKSVLD